MSQPLPAVGPQASAPAPARADGTLPESVTRQICSGCRVLQIGANSELTRQLCALIGDAALLSVQKDLAGVESVRAPLGPRGRNLGLADVQVGDLADGRPDAAPYDLIVSSVAVRGLPQSWLAQLAGRGALVVPYALGGRHPWVVVRNRREGSLRARLIDLGEDGWPEPVAGPFYPDGGSTPASRPPLPAADPAARYFSTVPILTGNQWGDLWAYMATHRPDLVTVAMVTGRELYWGPTLALVSGEHAVYVRPDALWATSSRIAAERLVETAKKLILHWGWAHRPKLAWWTAGLKPAAKPEDGLVHLEGWAQSPIVITGSTS
ncbi:hypothetical protein LN042_23135 [Kitasatospora sp. RB6PN24]|uniref:hypothetical protein n=1 Tax=Kitasatospora humi TaxID=2893891 RepID=UPI001E2B65C1|nr:hypothetical protein [Kitasatospora humi]MCC9309931.1 hypothetical protein [Kitasatospora humi]